MNRSPLASGCNRLFELASAALMRLFNKAIDFFLLPYGSSKKNVTTYGLQKID